MKFLSCACTVFAAASMAQALTIQLDFSQDTSTFFTENATAKAALQAAADDLGRVLTTQLTAISATKNADGNQVNDIRYKSGTNQAIINWDEYHINPSTGVDVSNATPEVAANTYRVFVGARALSTNILGQGGPGSSGYTLSGIGTPDFAGLVPVTNTYMNRGGPVLGTLSSTVGATKYDFTYGYVTGNLWFDNDGSSAFHYDHTTAVAAGRVDFYSVALHELTHAIGFGAGDTWLALQKDANGNVSGSGTTWTGANGIAANGGTGEKLVTTGHIASGIRSAAMAGSSASNVTAGAMQDTLMGPSLAAGVRKYFTAMDLAMMKDMGWTIVPEPSAVVFFATGAVWMISRRRRCA